MKRLTIAVMCLLMCFSTVMPTTALAKCAHKKTQWQTTQRATCCNTGVKKLICKNCGKVLNKKTLPKVSHQFKTFRTWKPIGGDSHEEISSSHDVLNDVL